MSDHPLQPAVPIEIRKACPKSWGELIGDEKKRFCSACSLHVHDAAQLTRQEAQALVAGTSERVCMRIEYDPQGAPRFRDSAHAPVSGAPRHVRLLRAVLSAAAGVLAACHGSLSTPASNDPAAAGSNGGPPPRMGKVCSTELLGEVAVPPAPPEILGLVALPGPTPAQEPEALPAPDGEAHVPPPSAPSNR